MSVQYAIEFADTHIEVRVGGDPDRESLVNMWREVVAACVENDCFDVLGLSTVERPTSLRDAIGYAKILEEAGVTPNTRVAWFNRNPAAIVMVELIAEVISNRRTAVACAFRNEAEARRWLGEDRELHDAR